MPADPNIILDAENIRGPDPNSLVSMFTLAQQVQQSRQQVAKQNMLLSTFADPNSVDPATGFPTPRAIQRVMSVDPELGVKMQGEALDAQVKRAQNQHYQTEAGKNNFDFMATAAGAGVDAYEKAKKDGLPEDKAVEAGRNARNETVKNNGGVIGDDVADGIIGKPFDPAGARALASTNKDWNTLKHQEKADQVAQDRLDQGDKRLDQQDKRLDILANHDPSGQKWQVLTDPKNQTQYRYNPETGESTTLNGKDPYEPGGAQKIAGGTAPRSAAAAYIQKFMQDNPDANADDISGAANKFRTGQSEAGTIGTRSGAIDVAAKEVSVFAKQALDASKAMDRSDTELANQVIQAWDMKTQNPKLRQLMIAADALVNARARAISPTGSPHVNDQLEGRKMLSSAFAKGDFDAAVEQMSKEAEGVKQSTKASKDEFLNEGNGTPKVLRYDAQGNLVK